MQIKKLIIDVLVFFHKRGETNMFKKSKKIFAGFCILIIVLLVGWIGYHNIKTRMKKDKYSGTLGKNLKFVTVNNKKIYLACEIT